MPFTPFHFGPGYLVKSFITKRFHFLSFVASQVLIDVETAYNIFQQNHRLHTFMHTYLGSLTVIPLGYFCVYVSSKIARKIQIPVLHKVFGEDWKPKVVVFSLFVGAWSHVLFDSIMHSDVRPFWPFSNKNAFNDLIDVGYLHMLCIVCASVGLIWANREEVKKGFN